MENTYVVQMIDADEDSRNAYGITHRSRFVYGTSGAGASPVRINVWDNTVRLNHRDGQPVRYGECGPIDGGNGAYLDPHNRATNDTTSVLITPGASVLSEYDAGTRQVFDPNPAIGRLRTGDTLVLVFPGGYAKLYQVLLTSNGHGVAEPATAIINGL